MPIGRQNHDAVLAFATQTSSCLCYFALELNGMPTQKKCLKVRVSFNMIGHSPIRRLPCI